MCYKKCNLILTQILVIKLPLITSLYFPTALWESTVNITKTTALDTTTIFATDMGNAWKRSAFAPMSGLVRLANARCSIVGASGLVEK